MKEYKRIPTGTVEEGKAQMVFAIIYATNGKPYEKYMHVDEQDRDKYIPVTLMQLRWDGYIGFPGGKVDPGEDLLTAVQREVKEEINANINKNDFIAFTTFATEKSNIHSFLVPMPYYMIKRLHENCTGSEHFLAENCGCILPHLAKYNDDRGIAQFLKNNFIATAKLELEALLSDVIEVEV